MKRYIVLIYIFCLFTLGTVANAQVTAVSLSVSPENSQTGDIVTVSASSYSEDLARSTFTWKANGVVVKKGTGVSVISFKKTATIPVLTIGVSINLASGQTIEQSVDITNQNLDLIWEAVDAHTPPFYKGKAMPVTEGAVRFNPIFARGTMFGSAGNKNNIYTWSRSNDVVGSASGTGKDSFPIIMDYLLDKEQINVRAESVVTNTVQETRVELIPQNIQVMFYSKINGFINWNKAISDGYTPTTSTQVIAVPYFITPKNLSNVSFKWDNGDSNYSNSQSIQITPQNGQSNYFSVSIENTKTFFQTVKKSLLLTL